MKFINELKDEVIRGLVRGLALGTLVVVIWMAFYHFCYHLDGQHFTLGDSYTVLEERITDFFGNDIIQWERKVPKAPMEIVIYEKRF